MILIGFYVQILAMLLLIRWKFFLRQHFFIYSMYFRHHCRPGYRLSSHLYPIRSVLIGVDLRQIEHLRLRLAAELFPPWQVKQLVQQISALTIPAVLEQRMSERNISHRGDQGSLVVPLDLIILLFGRAVAQDLICLCERHRQELGRSLSAEVSHGFLHIGKPVRMIRKFILCFLKTICKFLN